MAQDNDKSNTKNNSNNKPSKYNLRSREGFFQRINDMNTKDNALGNVLTSIENYHQTARQSHQSGDNLSPLLGNHYLTLDKDNKDNEDKEWVALGCSRIYRGRTEDVPFCIDVAYRGTTSVYTEDAIAFVGQCDSSYDLMRKLSIGLPNGELKTIYEEFKTLVSIDCEWDEVSYIASYSRVFNIFNCLFSHLYCQYRGACLIFLIVCFRIYVANTVARDC